MSKEAFMRPLEGQEAPLSKEGLWGGTMHCEMSARQVNVFSNKLILMDKSQILTLKYLASPDFEIFLMPMGVFSTS